jgi:hypothetical protein
MTEHIVNRGFSARSLGQRLPRTVDARIHAQARHCGNVILQRIAQLESALLVKREQRYARDGLHHGIQAHDRIRLHRDARLDVRHSIRPVVHHLTVLCDEDDETRFLAFVHGRLHRGVQRGEPGRRQAHIGRSRFLKRSRARFSDTEQAHCNGEHRHSRPSCAIAPQVDRHACVAHSAPPIVVPSDGRVRCRRQRHAKLDLFVTLHRNLPGATVFLTPHERQLIAGDGVGDVDHSQ